MSHVEKFNYEDSIRMLVSFVTKKRQKNQLTNRGTMVILLSYSEIIYKKFLCQNKLLPNQAGFVNGFSKKHHATSPNTKKQSIPSLFTGSLQSMTSLRSGKPMWLQNECAANGATKCPKLLTNKKNVHYRVT